MATYQAHLPDLLNHEGDFVVIAGDQVAGTWPTLDEALEAGYDRYGLDPFLVKQVWRAEPIQYFSRDLPACPS